MHNSSMNSSMAIKNQGKFTLNKEVYSANRSRRTDSLNLSQTIQSNQVSERERETPKGVVYGSSIQNFNSQHSNNRSMQNQSIVPKVHVGPFNTRCLFMDNAGTLFQKIVEFLSNNSINFVQKDPFSLQLS